jgi:hypothetical protein
LGVRARWVIIPTAKIPNNHRVRLDGSGVTVVTVQVPGLNVLLAIELPTNNVSWSDGMFPCVTMFPVREKEPKAIFHDLIAPWQLSLS